MAILEVVDDARVRVLTLNRPEALNALNTATIEDLRRAILELKADGGIRVAILTGAGDKSFVAGADINELAVQTPTSGREHALAGQHVFDLIENMGKPVIAAINGFALGGGCELAMACTLRLAADTARLGQPEVSLGLIPGYAGTQRLPRLVGKGRAMEMILTGAPVSADEAYRIGAVWRLRQFVSNELGNREYGENHHGKKRSDQRKRILEMEPAQARSPGRRGGRS